jgi:hypothetical protein
MNANREGDDMLASMTRLVGLVLALAMVGCASQGEVRPNVWRSLTPEQQRTATHLEWVMARIVRACEQSQPQCSSPRVIVGWDRTHPQYDRGVIVIPPALLVYNPAAHFVLAHELAHHWYANAGGAACYSEAQAVLCEQRANEHAITLLVIGWGYPRAQAEQIAWATLRGMAENAKPSRGHPNGCEELRALERHLNRPLSQCAHWRAGR